MEPVNWESLVDNRLKFGSENTSWHTVSIETASDFPLNRNRLMSPSCVLAARYKAYMPYISNYEVRSDDIWIVTYPRSGTTWTQEMVWLINNDCDFQKAEDIPLVHRSPTIRDLINDKVKVKQTVADLYMTPETVKNFQPPYHIKNHLPATFLPNQIWTVKPKIIYVARNPKDAAISFFHYYKMAFEYTGTMDEFLGLFLDGLTEFGSQTSHIMDFWNLRNEENVLFLTYEEMKNDLKKVIKTVATFLGKTITETQLEALDKYLELNSMRERANSLFHIATRPEVTMEDPQQYSDEKANSFKFKFFRRGKSDSYKDEMNETMIRKFDDLIERELTSKGCDIYA